MHSAEQCLFEISTNENSCLENRRFGEKILSLPLCNALLSSKPYRMRTSVSSPRRHLIFWPPRRVCTHPPPWRAWYPRTRGCVCPQLILSSPKFMISWSGVVFGQGSNKTEIGATNISLADGKKSCLKSSLQMYVIGITFGIIYLFKF